MFGHYVGYTMKSLQNMLNMNEHDLAHQIEQLSKLRRNAHKRRAEIETRIEYRQKRIEELKQEIASR